MKVLMKLFENVYNKKLRVINSLFTRAIETHVAFPCDVHVTGLINSKRSI